MILPKKNKEGEYYLSYSAINLWDNIKGFNTGRLGKEEFIRNYFFGEEYEDNTGFALFGSQVEDYIVNRGSADKFDDREKAILETIQPLGIFQKEIKIPFDGFFIKGFLDDCTHDFAKIRDYKTASLNSSKKYYEPEYNQLDFYALAIYKEHGFIPEMEVVCIEREGNGFRGGRDVMSVKENVWYIPRYTDVAKLKELEDYINKTAQEISEYYQLYLKLNR